MPRVCTCPVESIRVVPCIASASCCNTECALYGLTTLNYEESKRADDIPFFKVSDNSEVLPEWS